jgi:DNA-directed RNA polymerase subunit alpha
MRYALVCFCLATFSAPAMAGAGGSGLPDNPEPQPECANLLLAGRTLERLIPIISKKPADRISAYRLRLKTERMPAPTLLALEHLSARIAAGSGAKIEFIQIYASGSKLMLDFDISGTGKALLWALDKIQDPAALQGIPLVAIRWEEIKVNEQEEPMLPFGVKPIPASQLRRRIHELGLTNRSINALQSANIVYVGDLVKLTETELLKLPHFGYGSLIDVQTKLMREGLEIGMTVPGWPYGDL